MLMLIGLAMIVAGLVLSFLAFRRLRRFDAELHDFHGNPGSDPMGLRQAGLNLVLLLALLLALVIGPAFLLLGR